MANRRKFDACAKVGEYTDETGQKRGRYVRVGAVFENDRGELSLKMDAVPVDPGWSGWVNFFTPRNERSDNDGF